MIPDDRLQDLILSKNHEDVKGWSEGWAIIDGALVIYDIDSPPVWLMPILAMRDENGNSPAELIGVIPERSPTDEEKSRDIASVTWHDFPDNNNIYARD